MVHHYAKAIGVAVYQRCGLEMVGLFYRRPLPNTADHRRPPKNYS
jgi:hypothetical protein